MARDLMMSNMPATNGLICWLDGRDGSGNQTTWIDRSGNGNYGTLNNFNFSSNYWSEKGLVKTTQDNSVNVSLSPTLNPNYLNGFTVEIYFKQTSSSGLIYCKNNNWGIFAFYSNTLIRQVIWAADVDYTVQINSMLNNIRHVVAYYSTSKVFLYLDGVLLNSYSKNVSKTGSELIYLFCQTPTYGSASGEIYSFKIYNRELTQSEILQNYNYEKSITR